MSGKGSLHVNSGEYFKTNHYKYGAFLGGGAGAGGKVEVKRNSHVSLVSGGKEDSAMNSESQSMFQGDRVSQSLCQEFGRTKIKLFLVFSIF